MAESWVHFNEAVELIRSELHVSQGRAKTLLRAAVACGDICNRQVPRDPVSILADDGLIDFNLPGALNKGAYTEAPSDDYQVNADDLRFWLDEQVHVVSAAAPDTPPPSKGFGVRRQAEVLASYKEECKELGVRQTGDGFEEYARDRAHVVGHQQTLRTIARKHFGRPRGRPRNNS
jgi:hypothetical protein